MAHRRRVAAALAVWAMLSVCGCGGSGPAPPPVSGSMEEATVKGTVTIHGKPATGGEIDFNPANINRRDVLSKSAKISSDGSYSLKTLVGDNIVTVRGPGIDKDPALQTNSKSVSLKTGENALPIELP